MADDERTVRISILLTAGEAKELDGWRYANRFGTRSSAIRALMGAGMKADLSAATGGQSEPDGKRVIRVPLLLTAGEAKELDDWRYANRFDSRSRAIRALVGKGTRGKRQGRDAANARRSERQRLKG